MMPASQQGGRPEQAGGQGSQPRQTKQTSYQKQQQPNILTTYHYHHKALESLRD
jgi:hypothetical protein